MQKMRLSVARLRFYLRYAARNLRLERRWAAFSLLSIASGVAAVVALRALGLSIGDSLIANVRSSNHGDISISQGGDHPFAGLLASRTRGANATFSEATLARIAAWVSARDGQWMAYREASNVQINRQEGEESTRPQFIALLLIDPNDYGITGEIQLLEPRGASLADLLDEPRQIVISQNLADQQNLSVGERVSLNGGEKLFTVRGITATTSEASLLNIFASFFGFAYVSHEDGAILGEGGVNRVGITLPAGSDIAAAARALQDELGRGYDIRSTAELLNAYQEIATFLADFIALMGLGALLIGGVGIINTMLVSVRRRNLEIAALKTLGLKGRQVAALFLAEAFWLGALGSALGCLFGVLLGGLVNSYGETFLAQTLVWRVYPEALGFGVLLGMSAALTFSLAPLAITLQIRPVSVLRPNEQEVPRLGLLRAALSVLTLVLVAGAIVSRILNHSLAELSDNALAGEQTLLISILLVAAVLAFLGLLVFLLSLLVRGLSRLPSAGRATLRLAIRNIASQRVRTATTMLAIAAGMFALSSIAFAGQAVSETLRFTFAQTLGGNLLAFPLLPGGLTNETIEALPEPHYRSGLANYELRYLSATGPRADSITELDSDHPNLAGPELLAGRFLQPSDYGQPVLILSADSPDAKLGARVAVEIAGERLELTVIGILAPLTEGIPRFSIAIFGDSFIPGGLVEARPERQFYILDVPPAQLNATQRALARNPLIFSFDITFLDGLLRRLIDQFAAIPTVVGLLSLVAAAMIMANGVALATLERRRQIGILKALGMKRRRVLFALLLENAIIGVLGGALGVGLSVLGLQIFLQLDPGQPLPFPSGAAGTAVLLIAASLLIAALATFLSARGATRVPALDVLRYD